MYNEKQQWVNPYRQEAGKDWEKYREGKPQSGYIIWEIICVFNENTKKALSDDPIQSLKYHLVVTAGVLARYCIEGGMEHARAYEISDYYIRKADKALTGKEVADLNSKMCMDYTVQMEKQHKQFVYSKQVVKSIDYIYSHLHCRITIPEIASYVKLNENYFSKLFSKEVGIPVSRYIMKRKIEAAEIQSHGPAV